MFSRGKGKDKIRLNWLYIKAVLQKEKSACSFKVPINLTQDRSLLDCEGGGGVILLFI